MQYEIDLDIAVKYGVNLGVMYKAMPNEQFNDWDMTKKKAIFPFWNERQIRSYQDKLIKLGFYVKKTADCEEIKRKVLKNKNKGNICEWCKCKNPILHEHHYPIPKRNGGTETVRICPNCHYTFHLYEGR